MKSLRKANDNIDINKLKNKFFVFDTETTKLEPMPKNFVLGVIYGYYGHKVIKSVEEFKKEFALPKYENKYIFAHNAEFDLLTVFGNVYTEVDNAAIFNGKFISAKLGKVTFADSMNIFPTSVAKIGDLIGLKKLDNEKVKAAGLTKENYTVDDIDYCIRDCKIVYKALLRIFEMTGNIKITLPSLAMYDFRRNYMKEDFMFNDYVDNFYDSYYGGRTEAFKIGKVKAQSYDINSLYPYAMLTTVFPDIKHLKKEVQVDLKFLTFCLNHYEGMVSLKVRHKETYFGFLPVRMKVNDSEKLVFPVGEFETTVNFNELRFALKHKVIEILKINYMIYANPIKSPFIDFINDNYNKRMSSTDELNRTIYKLKMNSLYGRFAMRMKLSTVYYDEIPFDIITELKEADKYCDIQLFNQERKDCYVITENEKFKNSFFSIPTFSSYITSQARIILLQSLLDNESNNVVYCDTDSVFIEGVFSGVLSNNLGDFKNEGKNVTNINGLKNYDYENAETGEKLQACKGISKNAEKKVDRITGETEYHHKKYYKTKQALRQNKEAGESFIMIKTLKHKYDKRTVDTNGNTKPIKL